MATVSALPRPLGTIRRCASVLGSCAKERRRGYGTYYNHYRYKGPMEGGTLHYPVSYVVLLPEIPPDSAETNPIMRLDSLPEFSDISPEDCVNGVAKLSIEYETELSLHTERIPSLPLSFDALLDPLEQAVMPLNYAWKTCKHLNYVRRNEKYPKAFRRVHPHVLAAKNEKWSNKILYEAVQQLREKEDDITEYQRRVLDVFELNGRLNGIRLEKVASDRHRHHLHVLNEEKNKFRDQVKEDEEAFSSALTNPDDVLDMPHFLIKALADDKSNPVHGPWNVTLNPKVYHPFMEYCPNREARWNAWQAFYNKAGPGINLQKTNNMRISNIRFARIEQAKILGFKSFADMSQETKMAGSVDVVLGFLENMRSFGRPVLVEAVKELEAFAKENGFRGSSLELHDVPYWRRRQRESLYPLASDDAVADFFPFEVVFDRILHLLQTLFGIKFERIHDADVYHPDVRLYEVTDVASGDFSHLYVDPFAREDKIEGIWFESGRERCHLTGSLPIGYLNCSFAPTTPTSPVTLTFSQLTDLFFEMGMALRNQLTQTPYSEISGSKNVEWDAVDVPGFVFTHFLSDYRIVRGLSSHVVTGDPLPEPTFHHMIAAQRHFGVFDLLWQTFLATFDVECYVSYRTYWLDLWLQIYPLYMPFKMDKAKFMLPCGFNQIFAGDYPAAYYSQKWAEMVAADAWTKFHDTGFDLANPDTIAVGHQFKSTFFHLGGGVHSTEVFRRFRGNDPSTDAMLKKYALN